MRLTKAEKAKRLRSLLVKACNAHIKKGGKIAAGAFAAPKKACCPIWCAVGEPSDGRDFHDVLSEKLKVNISNDDMWAFIAGFDSGGNEGEKTNAFVNLGVDLHKKYIKEKK